MEFGVLVPQGWRLELMGVDGAAAKWATFRRVSRALEDAGWESLWVYDHFHTFPDKKIEATFEAWTMMAALAEITTTARLGQFVTCAQYRPPAYLAKVAACVDVACGGRLNVGVGAGWYEEEFRAYGYDYATVGRRLERLEETLEVLRAMWTQPQASYAGSHFSLADAVCEPKPLQRPHPPIWIGGRGPKVLLRLVATYADVWNYNGPLDDLDDTVEILKRHCLDVGRDFDEIKVTAMSGGLCYESEEELDEFMRRIEGQGRSRQSVLDLISCNGTREQCAEYLRAWQKKGCDGIVFFFNDIASYGDGRSQAEIFERDVLPQL